MSSHREAPEISKDPVADNTDVYAFVSPDKPDTVTLIANYIPLEGPAGGPNFYEFGDDVLYEIHIDNDGDGLDDITYQFRFHTTLQNRETFLYNTGPICSLTDRSWNKRQFYSVTRLTKLRSAVLAENLASPPCNIGPASTPRYAKLAQEAVHVLPSGETVFAGQRAEGFYVDLGSVFDLLDLRPFQNLHVNPLAAAPGVNGTNRLNVHTMAIQLPKTMLTRDGSDPGHPGDPRSVIGVYASASRRKARILGPSAHVDEAGPWVQVSRLGSPLFNEVMIPLGLKDRWNATDPAGDKVFLRYVEHQEVARRLVQYYPGVFPNLAAYTQPRTDMVAIFLTGIPAGIIPGFQNFTGPTLADLLRLNLAIPPAVTPNILGILGGDLAGFPNGRRVFDDVFTIELRALAGVTIPLVDPSFTPDAASSTVTDGVLPSSIASPFLANFPYLGTPVLGFRKSKQIALRAVRSACALESVPVCCVPGRATHRRPANLNRITKMTREHEDRVHSESVVLDIGGEIGALVIYTRAGLRGREIEISQEGSVARVHVEVLERRVDGRPVFAAVFPTLPAGNYAIWENFPARSGTAVVGGGEVTTVDWR